MITATAITKSYGAKRVLDGVGLTIAPGQIIALVGPSGSGKSTLLRAVSLLEPPDEGTVTVDDVSYAFPRRNGNGSARPWPKMTAVFQQLFLWPHLSIRQNITLPLHCHGAAEANGIVEALIDRFQMEEYADRFPNEVSLGERQRAALARALSLRPKYLLLDEVTSALDVEHVSAVLNYLKTIRDQGYDSEGIEKRSVGVLNHVKTIRDQGVGILLITHLIGFARRAADHVLFMDHGRILEEGPAEILSHPQTERLQEFLSLVETAS
jgi:ABC-type polar amino acid transport system ATPase subunit